MVRMECNGLGGLNLGVPLFVIFSKYRYCWTYCAQLWCRSREFSILKLLVRCCSVNYTTVFAKHFKFFSYTSFSRVILTCTVPGDRNNPKQGNITKYMNHRSSLNNCAVSESMNIKYYCHIDEFSGILQVLHFPVISSIKVNRNTTIINANNSTFYGIQ